MAHGAGQAKPLDAGTYDFTYISFGAGVQSTALLVMSNMGLYDCPFADVAIFADTQCEPAWVYEHLALMEKWSAIPVVRVTAGNLGSDLKACLRGKRRRAASIPAWTTGRNGRPVPLWRECTEEYKIAPIQRKVREMLGYGTRQAVRKRVACLLGISNDEARRMRPSRLTWSTNLYPLVAAHIDRATCVALLQAHGIPTPLRSACVFCPYHSDAYWRELRLHHQAEWRRAVNFDRAIRDMRPIGIRSPVYLHRARQPLTVVDLQPAPKGDVKGFIHECDGLCGV